MDALKEEISVTRTLIAERREQLRKEFETHTHMKKDIEVCRDVNVPFITGLKLTSKPS